MMDVKWVYIVLTCFVIHSNQYLCDLSPHDPTSYSRPENATIKHMSLALRVDFKKRVFHGVATLYMKVFTPISYVPLDVNNLTIHGVFFKKFKLQHHISNYRPFVGSCLMIYLPDTSRHDHSITLKINYTTHPSAAALMWVRRRHTLGKYFPYVFSQCSLLTASNAIPSVLSKLRDYGIRDTALNLIATYLSDRTLYLDINGNRSSGLPPIHARSILPCQDTPSVKFSFDAVVDAPRGMKVLMSALKGDFSWTFYQPLPIASSTFAIAIGDLRHKWVGPRSRVWSESKDLDRNAKEFSITEEYLNIAERLCSTYEWGVYDVLVVPPMFPYAAMENPCLTFVSPSVVNFRNLPKVPVFRRERIWDVYRGHQPERWYAAGILKTKLFVHHLTVKYDVREADLDAQVPTPKLQTGDKSQTYIIAHEIMHSWMGNSVSIKNFEHFWLKEAFTVYLERLATSSLNKNPEGAKQDRDLQYLIGLQTFIDAVAVMGTTHPLTKLVLNFTSVTPDEVHSVVPYEKGSLFLRYLEELFGGPNIFIMFIKSYIKHFRMKSVDSNDFQQYLTMFFKENEAVGDIDWHTWLHKSGMPPVIPRYDTTLIEPVVDLVESVLSGHEATSFDVADFSVHQKIYLMQLLIEEPALPLKILKKIGKAYNFTRSQNPEITYRWLRLCLRSRDEDVLSETFDFVNKIGRLKYIQPLYKELNSWHYISIIAKDNFLDHERYMSFAASNSLRRTLGVEIKV